MNINDVINGFKVINHQQVNEIKAEAWLMEHEKTGAKLLWLDRDDDNKTFAITFKTVPEDSTGVFHILEHSTLNGSDKYPVKEPFVDLLKSSLQTFLNAMTFPDKTMYPISSRNKQDFYNLMRVYLDAVFHPLVISNPNTFYQEGWHYELTDKDSLPGINGVVYSEMQGAYSSAATVMTNELLKALYPDTTYGNESGGHPDNIVDLTYEAFCAAHKKFYNASNSYITLDGNLDIKETLAIINDEYLSEFTRSKEVITIDYQTPVVNKKIVKEYELEPSMDPKNRSLVSFGYVVSKYDEVEINIALSLIANCLTANNSSPLKKAILDKKLAEDVSSGLDDSLMQPFFSIDITNTEADKYDEIKATVDEVLTSLVENGLDHEELLAGLSKMEFSALERDFGGAPKGIVFAIQAMNSWLYGGNPIDGIVVDKLFDDLRQKVNENYFEKLIAERLLASKHYAGVCLIPSTTLAKENNEKLQKKMQELKDSWTQEEIEALIESNKQFTEWQKRSDTPEDKAKMPKLTLEDVFEKPAKAPLTVSKVDDVTVLKHDLETSGINYVHLYFDINDLTLEQLSLLSFMSELVGETDTANYTTLKLQKALKFYLGDFNIGLAFLYNSQDNYSANNLLDISFSCLDKNKDKATAIVKEILFNTTLDNSDDIHDILRQIKFTLEQRITASGSNYGSLRLSGYESETGVCKEYASGYQYYCFLKELEADFDKRKEELAGSIKDLLNKILVKNRLTVSLTGNNSDEFASQLIELVPQSNEVWTKVIKKPLGKRKEGIAVASPVGYCCYGTNIQSLIKDSYGTMNVIAKILTYDYLWQQVRVQNGAYGTGFGARVNGDITFYSYRDPNANNSLDVYRHTADYLKEFVKNNSDVVQYIIGTIGDVDPYATARQLAASADAGYFTKTSYDSRCINRAQILSATPKAISDLIDVFAEINANANICVVANRETLEAMSEIETILEL